MPILLLIRKNFTEALKNKIDDLGFEGLFASTLLGGKDKMKEAISSLPDEQKIYIDTNYVMSATSRMKVPETGDIIFQITLASSLNDKQNVINIKGEEYEDFIRAWAGKREYLGPGTYKVGFGQDCKEPWAKLSGPKMWAEVSEDGLTVTVKEEKPV
jgi:hypothetical protein